ncbi:MAG: glycosyltransferase family 1 protein [Haliscomenobacteraceae bacterium CHB4]|nr:Glycosyltransferase Gtf1 [Saprospiraceae bacterium]MCE7926242.1 glycosyltransferase family 1 protein [Haliscomenobacteraceae bacterium CHB4]
MSTKPIHYTLWQIGPGGMEFVVKYYTERFFQQRPLHVYGIRPGQERFFDASKTVIHSGHDGKIRPYREYFQYARRHRDAIFHLQNGGPLILILTLLAGVKNVVYHIHGTIYWKNAFQKLYLKTAWFIARMLLSRGKVTFVANSQYSAAIFREKALPLQPKVIYNGFDAERFKAKKSLRNQLRRIGYAGRLANGKNVDLVIRLFEEAAATHPELELHLAGDGALRPALVEQASKSRFADRIKFHGYVQDIPAFYASVDLFLFLSAYESFGNVIAEALLTGLPTLTSNIPVFEEIYGNEKDFILGDPKNYDAIKQKFLKVIEDFPRLARKAYDISASVEAQCSIENHLRQIENVYEKY